MQAEADILGSLAAIRKRNGLSVRDVAERMKVTRPAVSQIELAHRRGQSITLERLLRYCAAIGAEIYVVTPIGSPAT